ncbi:uncharacterized protein RJT21DRAFT_43487 [Scheffersomyces amazonensis]|uniref:uncharacterized protein n=1 Tax=Scheffersomyces amazonensis TaxID=1078765 RepID=UPI00315CB09E
MDDEEYQEDVLIRRLDIIHSEISNCICKLENAVHTNDTSKSTPTFNKLKLLIGEFEPNPKLLDGQLSSYIESLTNLFLTLDPNCLFSQNICEVIYVFSKIRGFKFVSNYFSSDIYIIDKLIDLINQCDKDNQLFVCLIWLSNLTLAPFKLNSIDSHLMHSLYTIGLTHLKIHSNASKNQIVASILLSRLVTRPDSSEILQLYLYNEVELEWKSNSLDTTARLGHLITLNKILKRITLSEQDLNIIYDLITLDLLELQKDKESLNNINILYMIKILSKLSSRFTNDYLKISLIINNLINDVMNLLMNTKLDMKLRYEIAKSLSDINRSLSLTAVNYQHQLITYLIGLLELDFNQEEIQLDYERISIPKYHTVLLFLGYISLNKSLPTEFIPQILKIIHKTLFVEQRRFQTVLGTQVRDSSCFILWSLYRSLKISDLNLYKSQFLLVLFDLIKVIVFDSDLVVRKCGIAVLQEFVGRFGQMVFNHVEDLNDRGAYIIKFVEIFSNPNKSFQLIDALVEVNINKNLFIQVLIDKISNRDIPFDLRKHYSHCLKEAIELKLSMVDSIDFGLPVKNYTVDEIIQNLIDSGASIYSIVEVMPHNYAKFYTYLEQIYSNYEISQHSDNSEKVEGYIKLLNYLLSNKTGFILTSHTWKVLFQATRVNESALEEFHKFFSSLSSDVINDNFNTIVHNIENSNYILSSIIFNYRYFNYTQLQNLIRVIENTNIDCDIRTNLLTNLSANFDLVKNDEDILTRLIHLLDDYTVTERGDVGSKIRLRVLQLIDNHFNIFRPFFYQIELKAVRLIGELIDKIRIYAFQLLLRMHDNIQVQIPSEVSSTFFKVLFEYFHQNILESGQQEFINQFLIGISFTIGATVANKEIINESFTKFLHLLNRIDETSQLSILNTYLDNLQPSNNKSMVTKSSKDRQIKLYIMILKVFDRIFESNYQFPSSFKFELLFIRCYNLHINTTNFNRISISIRIFQYITEQDSVSQELKVKILKRLVWLSCQHKLPKVRKLVGDEILFEINQHQNNNNSQQLLSEINWEKESPNTLKNKISVLEQLLIAQIN